MPTLSVTYISYFGFHWLQYCKPSCCCFNFTILVSSTDFIVFYICNMFLIWMYVWKVHATDTFKAYNICQLIINANITKITLMNENRHVFVKPRWQQSENTAKISKSYILTPPHPQGHLMSVKCEEPIDELTVKVWLLYHHSNFNYCTF